MCLAGASLRVELLQLALRKLAELEHSHETRNKTLFHGSLGSAGAC